MDNKNNYKELYDNLKKSITEKRKEYKSNISAIIVGLQNMKAN